MIVNNPNLPQHNMGVLEDFIEAIKNNDRYFMFLAKTNTPMHILSNITEDKILDMIKNEMIRLFESYRKERHERRNSKKN